MKKGICAVIMLFLVCSVFMFSQVKKVEVNKGASTTTTVATSVTTPAVTKPSANLPLPQGVKRIDANVLQREYFECQKCKKEFAKAGKCPLHNIVLTKRTKSYTYKCKLCGYMNEKEVLCPGCKGNPPLKKFEVTYQCIGCKKISSEPGKCPKCKQDLKRIINVEIKK
ncbi:MAG: hypothetical protein V1752_05750 [Candidatus Firestonebacteria bacterium]